MDLDLLIILTHNPDVNLYKKIFAAIDKLEYNLIGFTTIGTDKNFYKFEGYMIYPFDYVHRLKYDYLIVDRHESEMDIFRQHLSNVNIPAKKIKSFHWIIKQLMINKYEDDADPAIQETLQYWQTHELSVWNQHIDERYPHTLDELYLDENCGLEYINFQTVEGKTRRMYFPKNGGERVKTSDGKFYIKDILREQLPTSPHLYITDNHRVEEGDILIDAGVCEGNFALRYADICSKIYLFEMEQKWFEPLYRTFEYCWDKVTLIPKALSDSSGEGGGGVSLDNIISMSRDQKYFLKMDIEGAEPNALHGAKNLLQNNKVKASICSYHNTDDKLKIKSILQKYGYKTWTSDGYMIFIHNSNIWETADFRKGIVYAENF